MMELLAPDVHRIAPEGNEPSMDRAPDELASGTPEPLRSELIGLLGEDRVLTRAIDLIRYASDASPYRLLPKAIVMARDADDVSKVLAYARSNGVPVTFRAGGTSLNGQAQSDGILVDVRRHWSGVEVLDGGARARVKPGTVLGHANRVLWPHGRKLGPDPASTDIACVGGVLANNSGGMRCGVVADSYSTVSSLTFVLPSGTVIDTAAPDADERFAAAEPELTAALDEIRDEIRADDELRERIRKKFRIKNTTGYRLCAFLDEDEPVQIFRRLLIGSEGTLGFIAEAVFETVPKPSKTTVSWLHFDGIESATEPVPALVGCGATAVELMVAPALMVAAQNIAGAPQDWLELPPTSAALLVEFGAESDGELDGLVAGAEEILKEHELIREPDFTRDEERIEVAWTVREGLHGLIGRFRAPGTSLIIEDVCVPPERIAESAREIQALLTEHGFLAGVAGHTSAGNLHFMLTPDFSKQEDMDRYDAFMGKLVELVLDKYDGSLKAEHGTGLNMAPYVEREWGPKATELMWRVKRLADPDGVLAPGVLLNRDPGAHLRNLKTTPEIEEVATTCVECGFCEPVCPSRHLTTTPRQRIVIRREMARQPAGSPVQRALLEQYEYDGIQTCAADGTCQIACPLGIDSGKLIKGFRTEEHTERDQRRGVRFAERWGRVERAARAGLRAGAVAGPLMRAGAGAARSLISDELVPTWPQNMPRPAPAKLPETSRDGAAAVYMPSCVNRIFGRPHNDGSGLPLPEAMVAVSARAGMPVWIPADVGGHCCAVPWTSKGYTDGAAAMANRTVESLWRWSSEGELPVVLDASSCALGLAGEAADGLTDENRERHEKLEILDSVAWARRLLPNLEINRKLGSAAVHATCSTHHLGLERPLREVAGAIADEVVQPIRATCCGMAGDRGMLHPELTASATAEEAAELAGSEHDAYLCSNRTCEIALQQGTGATYESFLIPLELVSRPRDSARP
ncbi:MAG TPA: FAD-binding and (Fe-S)-binding domain-containing protein [Solirubrobacterales bacterium]|nr:FAD-binding and (Fe-S)-binding domain-containing protein [Solirubrobacterales bacterium]